MLFRIDKAAGASQYYYIESYSNPILNSPKRSLIKLSYLRAFEAFESTCRRPFIKSFMVPLHCSQAGPCGQAELILYNDQRLEIYVEVQWFIPLGQRRITQHRRVDSVEWKSLVKHGSEINVLKACIDKKHLINVIPSPYLSLS